MSEKRKVCSKCSGEMIATGSKGKFETSDIKDIVNIPVKGFWGITNTTKYMCKECGYIEEYADDLSLGLPKNILK